jgi:predicted nuclease of predicted toxin-antitoxin system
VRFLVDAQLPPALARWIEAQGETAAHVADLGLVPSSDDEVRQAAIARGAVIVTKDEDFAVRGQVGQPSARIVWVRSGNLRRIELLRRWAELWPSVRAALDRGEVLVEID